MKISRILLAFAVSALAISTSVAQRGHGSGDQDKMKGHEGCCSAEQKGESEGHGKMRMSRTRHHFVRDNGIPAPYKDMTSPPDLAAANGAQLYADNCAGCHGADGTGGGQDGISLDPAPTNIARFAGMRMASDDYLFWTVSEGGVPVSSAMPAFKEVLSDDQIWQIIEYLRQLN